MSLKKIFICLFFIIFLAVWVRMSWNVGNKRNRFLKIKSKMGFHHVVFTTPKTHHEKIALTVVEMQQSPDIEEIDSKNEKSCLNWTKVFGRKKCVNNQTDTDKLNTCLYQLDTDKLSCVVNDTVQTSEISKLIWKWQISTQSWQNEFIYWARMTHCTSGVMYWMKQLLVFKTNSVKKGGSLSFEFFPIVPGIKIVIWKQKYLQKPNSKCMFLLGF